MKRVLSLILAAALAVPAVSAIAASSASAQERGRGGEEGCHHGRGGGRGHRGTPAERVERHFQHLDERLHFTAAQGPQVRRILEQAAAQMAQIHAQPRSPARHDARVALFRQTSERIGAVLTPQQRTEFDAMRAHFVERMREREERRQREDEARRGI